MPRSIVRKNGLCKFPRTVLGPIDSATRHWGAEGEIEGGRERERKRGGRERGREGKRGRG